GMQVPDPYPDQILTVLTASGQELAVGAERQPVHHLILPGEGAQRLPRPRLPDLHDAIQGSRGEEPTVRAEREAGNRSGRGEGWKTGKGEAFQVVPFPAAERERALVEQFLGAAGVVIGPRLGRQGDALVVQCVLLAL